MTRKRKTRSSFVKHSALEILRALGYEMAHPLIVQEMEMRGRKSSDTMNSDFMKMICFKGIPACCLSAKGSGPTENLAEEAAAHAMFDFFRSALPNASVREILACQSLDSPQSLFEPLVILFNELEKALLADYLSISRVSQYDLTSPAVLRGREVKKRINLNITNPQIGYSSSPNNMSISTNELIPFDEGMNSDNDSDVQIINEVENGSSAGKRSYGTDHCKHGEIIKYGDYQAYGNDTQSEVIKPEIQRMREADNAQKDRAENFISRQMQNRKRSHPNSRDEVDFGFLNNSATGPPEVLCAVPNVGRSSFIEGYSSESDEDGIPEKRPKIASSTVNTESASSSTRMLVHMTTKNQKERNEIPKESDEEIGEMVDAWDENDDLETPNCDQSIKNVHQNSKIIQPANAHTENGLHVLSSSNEIHGTLLPKNFQVQTIGVVTNQTLASLTQKHVASANTRALNSIVKFSKLTWDHYFNNSQPDAIYDRKMRARQLLFQEIQKLFPDKFVSLQVTGSTVNGCGSYNSDVDMCLCYPTKSSKGESFDDFYCERSFSSKILRKVDKAFKRLPVKHPFKRLVKCCQVIPAKVPIIQLLLNGEFEGIDIDINVNNIAGIYNSHLIHYYSMSDVRFPALALMIKHWAMSAGVNNSPDGYLNSYTIILLVIHFLQCGVQPAVLPNLQYLFPEKFDKKLPLEQLHLFGEISEKIPHGPKNFTSIGELLVGFFCYYSHFDFDSNAISIRSAQVVSRDNLPKDTRNYPMFVEEPFDAINTARSVRTLNHMNSIRSAFQEASNIFSKPVFNVSDLGIHVVPRG